LAFPNDKKAIGRQAMKETVLALGAGMSGMINPTLTPPMEPQTREARHTIGILLIDEHAIVRSGLRYLIEKQTGMMVVGEAGNRADAVEIATRQQPEVVILDLRLGEEDGLELIPELLGVAADAKLVVFTATQDPALHHEAVRLGAMGVLTKDASGDLLIKAINRVHAGELWLNRHSTATLVSKLRRDLECNTKQAQPEALPQLTGRELEIVSLVGEGLKNKQIADRLCISEATVRNHLTSILKKVEVSDRLELLIYAYRNNLVSIKR
jgi:DNA-binding NarL/FixJ family response regulator